MLGISEIESYPPNNNVGNSQREGLGNSFQIRAPQISLPKKSSAIDGIDKKFTGNPVTETISMTVPIETSPRCSGFGQQLSLSPDYDGHNGPFGLGWNISLPSLTRITDKGLPQYNDAVESDELFFLRDEDIEPVLVQNNDKWGCEKLPSMNFETLELLEKLVDLNTEGVSLIRTNN